MFSPRAVLRNVSRGKRDPKSSPGTPLRQPGQRRADEVDGLIRWACSQRPSPCLSQHPPTSQSSCPPPSAEPGAESLEGHHRLDRSELARMIGIARANEDQEEQSHVTGQGSSRRRSTGDLEAPPLEAASSAPVSSLGSHLSQRGGLISDPEAFGRTLRILSDGKKDTAALEVALWDLVYLSATGIQEAKIHVAVLRAVQSVYRGHGSLASLQAAACWAVCGLTARSHILQAHAVAMEMHLDLHAIAKVHSGDEKVQEACWKALANMLKGYQAHVAISRQIRMDIFLRDLQSSLKKHRNHQGVQEAACWCIANITANSPQGKAIAAGLGLVRDIKLTVQFHKFASRVLQAALPALNNLVNHKANQRMAIHLGLINDLRSVMQSHRRDAELQELACWTLTSLTAQSPEAQSAAAESGLLNDINGAIMCHHSDVGTVFAATWALHNLTGTDTKVQAMALKLDVLQTLCALLQSHGGHAGVVEQACCVVQVMAGYSEESRALAIMSGLPQVITAALAAHPENALVKASGIEALKSMKVPMKKSKPRIPGWKRLKRAISGRNTGDPSAKKPAASGNAPIRPYAPISAAASQDSQPNASPEDRRLPIPKLPLLEHPKTPNDPAALHPPLSPRHLVSWLPRSRQSLSSSQSSPLSSQQSTSSGHTSEVRESMSFLTLDLHMDGLRSSSRLPDKIEEVLRGCSKSPGSSLSGAVRDCNANQSAAGPLDRMRQQFDEQGASVSPIHGSHKEGAQPDAGAPTANRERNAGHTCSSEDLPSQNHPEGQEGDAGRKSSGSGSSERSLTPGPSDDIPVSKVEDRDSPRTSGEEEGVFASSKGWFDALAGENRSKKQTAGSGFFVHGLAGASLPWRLSRSTRVIPRAVASAPSSPRKEAFQSEDRIEADGQALAGPKRAPGDPVIPCSEAEPAPAGDGLLCEFQSQIEQRIARPKGRSTDPNHQVTSSGDSEGQPHEAAEPTLAYESEQDAAVLPDADEHDGSLQWPMALLDMSQEYCEPVSSLNDARHVREPSEQLHTPPGSIPTGDRSSIPTAGVEVKHVGRNEEQGEDGSRAERTEQAFVKVEDGRESAGTPIKLSEQTGSHPDEEATKMPSAGQSENASDCNDRTASETFSATEPKHSEASSATKSHEKPQQGTDAEPRAEDLQKQAAAGGTERSPRVGVGAFEFPCESGGGAKSWLPVGGRHRDDGDFPDQACSEPREPATFQTIQHKALRWRRHRLASLRSQQSTSSLKERSERPPDDGCHVDLKGLSRKLPSSSGVDSDFAPFEGARRADHHIDQQDADDSGCSLHDASSVFVMQNANAESHGEIESPMDLLGYSWAGEPHAICRAGVSVCGQGKNPRHDEALHHHCHMERNDAERNGVEATGQRHPRQGLQTLPAREVGPGLDRHDSTPGAYGPAKEEGERDRQKISEGGDGHVNSRDLVDLKRQLADRNLSGTEDEIILALKQVDGPGGLVDRAALSSSVSGGDAPQNEEERPDEASGRTTKHVGSNAICCSPGSSPANRPSSNVASPQAPGSHVVVSTGGQRPTGTGTRVDNFGLSATQEAEGHSACEDIKLPAGQLFGRVSSSPKEMTTATRLRKDDARDQRHNYQGRCSCRQGREEIEQALGLSTSTDGLLEMTDASITLDSFSLPADQLNADNPRIFGATEGNGGGQPMESCRNGKDDGREIPLREKHATVGSKAPSDANKTRHPADIAVDACKDQPWPKHNKYDWSTVNLNVWEEHNKSRDQGGDFNDTRPEAAAINCAGFRAPSTEPSAETLHIYGPAASTCDCRIFEEESRPEDDKLVVNAAQTHNPEMLVHVHLQPAGVDSETAEDWDPHDADVAAGKPETNADRWRRASDEQLRQSGGGSRPHAADKMSFLLARTGASEASKSSARLTASNRPSEFQMTREDRIDSHSNQSGRSLTRLAGPAVGLDKPPEQLPPGGLESGGSLRGDASSRTRHEAGHLGINMKFSVDSGASDISGRFLDGPQTTDDWGAESGQNTSHMSRGSSGTQSGDSNTPNSWNGRIAWACENDEASDSSEAEDLDTWAKKASMYLRPQSGNQIDWDADSSSHGEEERDESTPATCWKRDMSAHSLCGARWEVASEELNGGRVQPSTSSLHGSSERPGREFVATTDEHGQEIRQSFHGLQPYEVHKSATRRVIEICRDAGTHRQEQVLEEIDRRLDGLFDSFHVAEEGHSPDGCGINCRWPSSPVASWGLGAAEDAGQSSRLKAEGKEKQRSATRSHEAGRQFSSDASRQAKSIPTSKVASARPRDSSYNAPPAGGSVSSRSASHDGRTMVGCGSPSAEQQIFLRLPSKRLAFPASGDALLSHCKRAIQHISNQRLCYKIGLTADPVQFMSKSAKRMSPFKYMTIIYQHRVSIPCPDVAISDRATCAMLQRISKRQAQLLLSRLIQHIKLSTKDPYCKNRDGDAEAADGADPADFLHHFSLYVVHTG